MLLADSKPSRNRQGKETLLQIMRIDGVLDVCQPFPIFAMGYKVLTKLGLAVFLHRHDYIFLLVPFGLYFVDPHQAMLRPLHYGNPATKNL